MIVATACGVAADVTVQHGDKSKKNFDLRRTAFFGVFGGLYCGAFGYFLYIRVFARLCPSSIRFANLSWREKLKDRAGQKDVLRQVALDNFVTTPFMFMPVFYSMRELFQGDGLAAPSSACQRALGKYSENFLADNKLGVSVWIPGGLIGFALPAWLRMPFFQSCNYIFTAGVSFLRGSQADDGHGGASTVPLGN